MAWSFAGARGSANNKVSGSVLAASPTQTINVNAVVMAVAVSDNIATGGGQTQTHVVTDFKGNLWTKLREQSNAALAGAGLTLSVWLSQLTAALTTADSVVLGLSAATTAKALGLYEYAVSNGNRVRLAGHNGSEQDTTSSPTVTLNTLTSGAYALFGVVGREDDTAGTYVQDADYNDRTKFGTTGSTGNTNVSCIVGDRLATLTGDTFAPTALSIAADVATILVALEEVNPFTLTVSSVVFSGGRCYLNWSDGSQDEFASLQQAQDSVASLGPDTLKKMALARYLAADPTGSNPSIMAGKSISYSAKLDGMVRVS